MPKKAKWLRRSMLNTYSKVNDRFKIYLILQYAWTGGKLNFNQSFLQFNLKKKSQELKSSSWFDFKCWILETATQSS